MSCYGCLWMMLAAGTISVRAIHVDVLDTIQNWPTACQPPQPLEDSNLLHAECGGLATLQDVRTLLRQDIWSQLGSLTISNSNLTTNLTVDDLVDYPALHTLTIKKSRLKEWREIRLASVPRVRVLVLEQCWDNDTYLAKYKQLTLILSSKLQDALPDLEELYLIDIFTPHIAEPRALKNLNRLIIEKGAAECLRENFWMLKWYNDGKMEINSTVCFVGESEERLDMMHSKFSFVDCILIQVLRFLKSVVEDCPVACHCEVTGIKSKTPLTPITFVNCNSANLTQLPDIIPSHTSKLFLGNNRITNISKIFINPRYRSLNQITLENNLIDHLDGELLCNYLENHELDLSITLANNRLETLPVEHLRRMYKKYESEGHKYLPTFNLDGNPWNCDDCDFLVPFQSLISYQKDSLLEIRCGEGRYAEGQPIIRMPVRKYCKVDPPLEPLDILNICLGILLLLFIINFLHNLVQYQRHGKLPWIVTKFPCC